MPAISMTIKHGQTKAQAVVCLKAAVVAVRARFGLLIQGIDWSETADAVHIRGIGFAADLRVDDEHTYLSGDVPMLAGMLNSSMVPKLKQIVQDAFQRRLK